MESPLIKQQFSIFNSRHSVPIWSFFKTQSEALQLCQLRKKMFNQDLQIFSKEIYYDDTYGKRQYLVTNYIHFFKKYKSMKNTDKCYYEVIREGFKCKLYFDIEYGIQYNPNIDGNELMNIFKDYLIEYILKELNINITRTDIIDLTSTTDIKFSRHLIIIFPTNAVFKNNQECGIFVRRMCDEIRQTAKMGLYHYAETQLTEKGKKLQRLFIYDMDPNQCYDYNRILFIDEAVYTRNRCFRILNSSKLKYIHQQKNAFIGYAPNQERKFRSKGYRPTFKEQFIEFMDTLICAVDVDENTKIIQFPGHSYSYSLSFGSQNHHNTNSGYFKCKSSPFPRLDDWIQQIAKNWSRSTAPWIDTMKKIPNDITSDSPLYDAVKNDAKIIKWMIFNDKNDKPSLITYSVENNRFCMNIARCHKSNGIYFAVKINEKIVQQKCFDSECRNFASPPIEIAPYLLEIEDDDFEQQLVQSTKMIEKTVSKRDNNHNVKPDVIQDDNTRNLSQLSLEEEVEDNLNERLDASYLMEDKPFELKMVQSTEMIEKRIAKRSDKEENDENADNDEEPSYLLEDDSFNLKLLENCTKIEEDYAKKENLNDNKENITDSMISTEETPLIERCLFKTPTPSSHSLISNKSGILNKTNESNKSLKRNLDQLFDENGDEKDMISPIKSKRQKIEKNDFEFDDEWDDEFISKLDQQIQNDQQTCNDGE